MQLKILTFNWHEPYICLLARVGWEFFVVEPDVGSGQRRLWDYNMRPLPSNATIISADEAHKRLDMESFDLVIANNIKDLVWVKDYALPKINVFHCRLSTEIEIGNNQVERESYLKAVEPILKNVRNVFISESKRSDWDLEGDVIPHGLDVSDYKDYEGNDPSILRVGNLLKEMDVAKGFRVGEQIINGFPCVTLGLNPDIADSRLSRGLDDLMEHYSKCRVYLNTTMERYEDGYNLSLLEAMASGMPVVSYKHSGSPIVDGVNGFISDDISRLKRDVAFLLENPERAKQMGEEARNTIRRDFSLEKFLVSWRKVIHSTLLEFLKNSGISVNGEHKEEFFKITKKNVILDYTSHPATTAHYLERALRRKHNVVTCGAKINDLVREKWNLSALKWEAKSQDIPCGFQTLYSEVEQRLPIGWIPDLYFWVETGLNQPPEDLEKCKIPKACYLIDTHIHLEEHLKIARSFDFVFLAQKAYVEDFKRAGYEQVHWLPLGCDPEIHGQVDGIAKWDVGFVGTVDQAPPRRKKLLSDIDAKFDLRCERKFMEEMAELYSHSRMVFNNAIRKDLNMRVFEGMCSGSLLLTDRAEGSGLEDFFQDGVHLAHYQDETLTDTVQYYLEHPEEREKIAENGRAEVLEKHTYDHRIAQMLDILDNFFKNQGAKAEKTVISVPEKDAGESEKPDTYYSHVRKDLFPLIPETAQCILEVGCGEGATGAELKKRQKAFVAGIELNSASVKKASLVLDEVLQGNVETMALPYDKESFDCIIFADILEHLIDPLSLLKKVRPLLKPGGSIVTSIPNVQFYAVMGQLAEGNWTYQKEGILDETHLRFFTLKEIKKLLESAGFEISQTDDTMAPQYEDYKKTGGDTIKMGRITISDLTPEEMRQFFVFQYKISATVKKEAFAKEESSDFSDNGLLAQAEEASSKKNWELALKLFQDNEILSPNCTKTAVGLGNVYMHMGDMDKADQYYVKAMSSAKPPIQARLGMGILEYQRGNFGGSISYLENARNLEPENDKILTALGMAVLQTGDKEKAHDFLVSALESNIENTLAMNEFLNLSYDLKRFAEGERLLVKFLELHPANIHILFGLAGLQFVAANREKAKDTLNTLLIFDPEHNDARDLLDRIHSEESLAGVS